MRCVRYARFTINQAWVDAGTATSEGGVGGVLGEPGCGARALSGVARGSTCLVVNPTRSLNSSVILINLAL